MTIKKNHESLILGILFFLFLANTTITNAQCAGSDNTVTVCDKELDPNYKTYDLFAQLNGTPTAGGTWSTNDPANFFALNQSTGELNLWKINNFGSQTQIFGIHEFIYTNNCGGSLETATITLNLGAYPGEDNIDGNADACGSDLAVNLYSFIGNETNGKVPDFNGIWRAITPDAIPFLNESTFNATGVNPGIYEFTYTVDAVDICPSKQARLLLEVHRPPKSGDPIELIVCTNEDLSTYQNINLTDYLTNEDNTGTWSESIRTNELTNLNDNIINVENLNNTFGHGTYSFSYTVFPTHPICEESTTFVTVTILPALVGTMNSQNFCLNSNYTININYDATLIPNGSYEIEYQITDSNGVKTATDEQASLINGSGIFEVSNNTITPNEFVTLEIIGVTRPNSLTNLCPEVPPTNILVSNVSATATNICPDTDASIQLTNLLDPLGSLSNSTHDVNYTITDPNSNTTNLTATNVSFSNGSGNFTIPFANLPDAGDYTVAMNIPSAFNLDCMLSTAFTITPYPEDISLDLVVDNNCDATRIDVIVDAPVLANGGYTITYEVIDQQNNDILVSNTVTFNGGTADYVVDITTLPVGNYEVVLRSTQNDTTLCRTQFNFELTEEFSIGGIPDAPVADSNQSFCTLDFNTNGPSLSDIQVTATGTISFYDNETDTTALPLSTLLVNGEDYFISNTDPNNNCESSEKISVTVSLLTPSTIITTETNPVFCSVENATIASLNASAPNNGTIIWYDAPTNGNIINENDFLVDEQSYYAVEQLTNGCESSNRLEITPSIISPSSVSLEFLNVALCSIDQPTIATLQDLVINTSIEVDWFNSPTATTALSLNDLLIDKTMYYAESYDTTTGCINPERMAVTVDLTNCNPEDYNFFIPDGFSPNADSRNDTFFIPNIVEIFPDFTIEIFNRYGNLLFKGDKNNPSWDGNNQKSGGNTVAPNGVYFYILNYNREGFDKKQGRLYLNR